MRGRRSAIASRRAQPESSLEQKAAAYLAARRQAALAKAIAKRLEPGLIKALRADGRRGVAVSGLGKVSVVARGPTTRLDQRAATAALREAGLPVPTITIPGRDTIRASLD